MKRYLIQALFILVIGISVLSGCRNISTDYLASPTVSATETPTDTSMPAAIPTPALSPTPSPFPSPAPSSELSPAEKDKLISDYLNDVDSDTNAWVPSFSGGIAFMIDGQATVDGKLLFIESYGTKDFLVLGMQNSNNKNIVTIIELMTDLPEDLPEDQKNRGFCYQTTTNEIGGYTVSSKFCDTRQEYLSLLNKYKGSHIAVDLCYIKDDLKTILKKTKPENVEWVTFSVNTLNSRVSSCRSLLKGLKKPLPGPNITLKKELNSINKWKTNPVVTIKNYSQLQDTIINNVPVPITFKVEI